MKKFLLAASLLLCYHVFAQKVEETELQIPYKHQALFPFATGQGGMMQVYFDNQNPDKDKQKAVTVSFTSDAASFRNFIHIGMFTSFDLEKYGPKYSNQGKQDLKVTIRVVGEPQMQIDDAQGYIQQGYSSKQHFFKKGTYAIDLVADIKNSKGELLKTLVISSVKKPVISYFYDANLAKNASLFFRQYYSMNTTIKEIDSFYRMVNPVTFVGYNSKEQLNKAYDQSAFNTFHDVIRANAFNTAMLNLNYMLKAGLESVDKMDVYKLYSIAPKKEKDADKYADDMRAGELLNKALADLKKNNYVLTDAAKGDLQKAKLLYEELIKKSEKNVGQGLKSMFGGSGSAYYNALFNNGAIVDMLLGNYADMKLKIDRYEAAEKMSDAFSFKKMSGQINYKLDFVNNAEYRGKIEKGKVLLQELNP